MTNELRFDRKLLEEAIKFAGPEGEGAHRLVYHFLCMLRQAGWNWRTEHLIVLYDRESEPEYDEEYAHYLDRLASGLPATWPPSLDDNTEEE